MLYYKVVCRKYWNKGLTDEDYMICDYNGVEYDSKRDAEAVRLCAEDEGLEAWVERVEEFNSKEDMRKEQT